MRKVLLLFMALITVSIVMASCTQNKKDNNGMEKDNQSGDEQSTKKSEGGKTLVAYFSASGVTKKAAKQLAEFIGADLYEIEPQQPYSDADLDWRNDKSRSSIEMNDKTSRPAVKGTVENLADYDRVFIGFPIWWYTAPTIINTFIEKNDLKGKTLVPFATSGGSTIERACQDLKASYPDLTWKDGKLLNEINKEEILKWADISSN